MFDLTDGELTMLFEKKYDKKTAGIVSKMLYDGINNANSDEGHFIAFTAIEFPGLLTLSLKKDLENLSINSDWKNKIVNKSNKIKKIDNRKKRLKLFFNLIAKLDKKIKNKKKMKIFN